MEHNERIDDDSEGDERARQRAQDAALVARARAGDDTAFASLFDTWFDRVYNVAFRIVRDRDTAAELAQDAFLAAWRGLDGLADPASFGGWILRISRNAALNRVERERRSAPVDGEVMTMFEHRASATAAPPGFSLAARLDGYADPAAAVADAEVVAAVHDAVDALGDRDHEVLDLQLRYQLSPAEVGEVLGLNRNAANQLCHRVRARFAVAFGARVVWAGAARRCPDLAAALAEGGVAHFGADAVRVVTRHLDHCARCAEERETRLAPSALFSAVPLALVLPEVRNAVAAQLGAAGVPMGPNAGAAAAPASSPSAPGTTPTVTSPSGVDVDAISGSATRVSGAERAAGRARGVRLLAVVLAVLVVAVVAGFILMRPESARRPMARSSLGSGAPTQPSVSEAQTASSSTPAGSTAPAGGGLPVPAPTTASPTSGDPTTTTPASTVPGQVTVERFTVEPSGPQPTTYATAGGPVLTWSVVGATKVTIWERLDDGVAGDQRVRVAATGASGSIALCPGAVAPNGSCSAASGRYSYELEATAADGSTVTVPEWPGFTVLPPVIG